MVEKLSENDRELCKGSNGGVRSLHGERFGGVIGGLPELAGGVWIAGGGGWVGGEAPARDPERVFSGVKAEIRGASKAL